MSGGLIFTEINQLDDVETLIFDPLCAIMKGLWLKRKRRIICPLEQLSLNAQHYTRRRKALMWTLVKLTIFLTFKMT